LSHRGYTAAFVQGNKFAMISSIHACMPMKIHYKCTSPLLTGTKNGGIAIKKKKKKSK
jgi:hypothetical protein